MDTATVQPRKLPRPLFHLESVAIQRVGDHRISEHSVITEYQPITNIVAETDITEPTVVASFSNILYSRTKYIDPDAHWPQQDTGQPQFPDFEES